MNINYISLLPAGFNDSSRVWVYQSNRLFSLHEALQIEEMLKAFVDNWNTHGAPVKGYANLFFGQFIVIIADEVASGLVSGCSTDSSVRVIKDIELLCNVHMFDRLLLAFLIKERVQMVPMSQLSYALENNFITPDSMYFNNTVLNLAQLKSQWLIPVKESWISNDKRFSSLLMDRQNVD